MWKGNRGGRWTSGRPPQNRAIVLQGSREPLLVYRAGSQGSVTRFRSRLAVVSFRHVRSSYKVFRRALFLSVSLALLSLSLSPSLDSLRGRIVGRAHDQQIDLSVKSRSAVKSKVHRLSVGKVRKEKREKRRETFRATIVRRSINVC